VSAGLALVACIEGSGRGSSPNFGLLLTPYA
jgi:hypothetical protein